MSDLYTKDILRLAASVPYGERLTDPDVTVQKTSRICGSRITLDVDFDGDRIARLGQEVKACALGQATSALVAPKLIGKGYGEIAPAAEAFKAMIEGRGDVPDSPWDDLDLLLPVREHRSRHGSVMLIFEAALAALQTQGTTDSGQIPESLARE